MGRFLQADPFVQEPDYSQSLNRYSYVLNNPLSYTDPSGYFVDSLFSAGFRILVTAAGCTVGGPIGCGVASSIASLSLGQSVSQSLRNGALVAILPAVFNRIGNLIDDGIGLVAGSLLHGAVGAASAAIQGGDPLAGFVSGTLTKGFTLGTKDFLASINNIAAEVAITSIVGGTISELTGGDFANGAFTAGFAYAFNQSRALQQITKIAKVYVKFQGLEDIEWEYGDSINLETVKSQALSTLQEIYPNVEFIEGSPGWLSGLFANKILITTGGPPDGAFGDHFSRGSFFTKPEMLIYADNIEDALFSIRLEDSNGRLIDRVNYNSNQAGIAIGNYAAHELGHELDLEHVKKDGYIMTEYSTPSFKKLEFHPSNMERLNELR